MLKILNSKVRPITLTSKTGKWIIINIFYYSFWQKPSTKKGKKTYKFFKENICNKFKRKYRKIIEATSYVYIIYCIVLIPYSIFRYRFDGSAYVYVVFHRHHVDVTKDMMGKDMFITKQQDNIGWGKWWQMLWEKEKCMAFVVEKWEGDHELR